MKMEYLTLSLLFYIFFVACGSDQVRQNIPEIESPEVLTSFYYGADLSYVNEMEDCGAIYKNEIGVAEDPYKIFSDCGANLIRVRLWHNPTWTHYSNYDDVKKSISRAKKLGMQVLLDFYYLDSWTFPDRPGRNH
ncbi:glycosyl hydrolase 53 family protein [Formosa haliotis]|uniref:glycosyl hydrolase 53 family protein n=1 Tax=Formosa haliotis TaxID=1555194 RepID=UPI0008247064|nr:glycosyl hydrolase 53 family protein [Formosa haliotis]